MKKRILSFITALCMLATSFVFPTLGAETDTDPSGDNNTVYYSAEQAELTFSDEGIVETKAGSGYSIEGTALPLHLREPTVSAEPVPKVPLLWERVLAMLPLFLMTFR